VKQVIEHGWRQETSGRWSVLHRALDLPAAAANKKG
jgi:hypothetical protein